MQTIGMNYDIKPERVEDFKEHTKAVIEAMQDFDGHVETRLYADAFRPNSMMIYSAWDSVEQFQVFMRSDAFRQAIGEPTDMLEGMPSDRVYEEIGSL